MPSPKSTRDQPRGLFERLRAAVQVLLGQRLVPFQIQAEWADYQEIFQELLQRQSTYLARQAKAEKARLEQLAQLTQEPEPEHSQPPLSDRKAELRRRAAELRGLSSPRQQHLRLTPNVSALPNYAPEPEPDPEDDP